MYICIEGNIGAGKSTLARALAKKLNAHYLPELFEENTLLPLFYKNKKTFAFPTEYSFLIDRQKQLSHYFKAIQNNTITVSDYHIDKCLCFAEVNLSETDYSFYKKHFSAIKKTVKQPDLIVYLKVDVALIIDNIKKRGREMEQQIDVNYLKKLKIALDNYYLKQKNTLVITINNYNPNTINNCCNEIITHLK